MSEKVKIKKGFGEQTLSVMVLATEVVFTDGVAEVEPEIADVLTQIPGYEVETQASEENQAPDGSQQTIDNPATTTNKRKPVQRR